MYGPYTPGPNEAPEMGVYVGDARDLASQLPPHCLDLIFGDPVYQDPAQYEWIAQLANRTLKPHKPLLAYFGIGYIKATLDAIERGGRPVTWIMGEYQPGPRRGGQYHFAHWHALGWFGGKPVATFADMQPPTNDYGAESLDRTSNGDRGHKWRKPVGPARKFIEAFSAPGDVILDPFCGHGGLLEAALKAGRGYIGFEIDPERAERARERLRKIHNPPLLSLGAAPEEEAPLNDAELAAALADNAQATQLAMLFDETNGEAVKISADELYALMDDFKAAHSSLLLE